MRDEGRRLARASILAAESFRRSDQACGLTLRRRGKTEVEYVGGAEGRKRRHVQTMAIAALKERINELFSLYDKEESGSMGVLWLRRALGEVGERAIQRAEERGNNSGGLTKEEFMRYFEERSKSYENAGGEGGSGGYLIGAVSSLNHAIETRLKEEKPGIMSPPERQQELLSSGHDSLAALFEVLKPRVVCLAQDVLTLTSKGNGQELNQQQGVEIDNAITMDEIETGKGGGYYIQSVDGGFELLEVGLRGGDDSVAALVIEGQGEPRNKMEASATNTQGVGWWESTPEGPFIRHVPPSTLILILILILKKAQLANLVVCVF